MREEVVRCVLEEGFVFVLRVLRWKTELGSRKSEIFY